MGSFVMTGLDKSKVCIYTAIYGGYEILLAQPEQTIACDFVCFTDDQSLMGQGWKVIYRAGDPALNPRVQSQFPKIVADEVFASAAQTQDLPQYDYTIWVDANAVIKVQTFAQEMLGYLDRFGIAMFKHPDRDCIYDEVAVCLTMPKYQSTPISEQAAQYQSESYPAHNGLFACGFIARDMRRQEVRELDEAWWAENRRWCTHDQASLPYVLWKNNYGCDVIGHYLWNNHLFRLEPHYQDSPGR